MSPPKPHTPEELSARGVLARRTRDLGPDHPLTREAQSRFRSEKYLAAVRAAVADAPPLSPDQKSRLAQALRPVVTLIDGETRQGAAA